jgi:hypothetical protein
LFVWFFQSKLTFFLTLLFHSDPFQFAYYLTPVDHRHALLTKKEQNNTFRGSVIYGKSLILAVEPWSRPKRLHPADELWRTGKGALNWVERKDTGAGSTVGGDGARQVDDAGGGVGVGRDKIKKKDAAVERAEKELPSFWGFKYGRDVAIEIVPIDATFLQEQ